MMKTKIKLAYVLLCLPFLLTACSSEEDNAHKTNEKTTTEQKSADKTTESKGQTSKDDVYKEHVRKLKEDVKKQMGGDVVTENGMADSSEKNSDVHSVAKEAEKAQQHANELGYEWSTTEKLMADAHAAVKAGNVEQATALFNEAKKQSKLAVEQALYADEHWQLLVPK